MAMDRSKGKAVEVPQGSRDIGSARLRGEGLEGGENKLRRLVRPRIRML